MNKGAVVNLLAFKYSVSDTVDLRREGHWTADQKEGLGTCRRQKSAILLEI